MRGGRDERALQGAISEELEEKHFLVVRKRNTWGRKEKRSRPLPKGRKNFNFTETTTEKWSLRRKKRIERTR